MWAAEKIVEIKKIGVQKKLFGEFLGSVHNSCSWIVARRSHDLPQELQELWHNLKQGLQHLITESSFTKMKAMNVIKEKWGVEISWIEYEPVYWFCLPWFSSIPTFSLEDTMDRCTFSGNESSWTTHLPDGTYTDDIPENSILPWILSVYVC